MENNNKINHVPVLFDEIMKIITPDMRTFFDGTFGYWWHTIWTIKKISTWHIDNIFWPNDAYSGIENKNFLTSPEAFKRFATDMDSEVYNIWLNNVNNHVSENSLTQLQISQNISDLKNINIYNTWYHQLIDPEYTSKLPKFDFILLDLGANMHHFKKWDRWFSIKLDWELDMRYNTRTKLTAKTLINDRRVEKIAELLVMYGDFTPWMATKIWNTIYTHRKSKHINTTLEFSAVLLEAWLNNTRIAVVFQCIRIAVNDEFGNITKFLDNLELFSHKNTVVAVITFHSLEDKLTKYKLAQYTDAGTRETVNKHVIKPVFAETKKNPASASAKLRIIKKK